MDRMEFTIYFEKPFWIGLCIYYTDSGIKAAKHVFGNEPSNGEILEFYRDDFGRLEFFSIPDPGCNPADGGLKKNGFKKSLKKGGRELRKPCSLSFRLYNEGLKNYLEEEKKKRKSVRDMDIRYSQRSEKRKKKKRGH